jgi:hypothetical protein
VLADTPVGILTLAWVGLSFIKLCRVLSAVSEVYDGLGTGKLTAYYTG